MRVRKPRPAYRVKKHPEKTPQLCVHCGKTLLDYEALESKYCFNCLRKMGRVNNKHY